MKKKNFYFILSVVASIVLFSMLLRQSFTEFVYFSPNLNTEVLPYISKTISNIDEGINYALKTPNGKPSQMRVLYKNAYGSGFLKHNAIPNDLDYSVGINLGKYYYNGKNSKEIAKEMEDKISTFEIEFYDYINNKNKDLVSNYNLINSVITLDGKKAVKINSMAACLDKIFENKDYIFHTVKKIEDTKNLKYPFLLKSNEILLEDYSPILLFSQNLQYSKDTTKFLREVTIVLDFFADVENTKTKQVKSIEIVSESFVGQKFQLSRRFFVPTVFVGENSARYLKNLAFLNDDKEYLEHRLLNYRRSLQEFSNLNEINDRPVKMLKRILQCRELIEPALDKDLKERIYQSVSKNLDNKDIQAANDYSTAMGNLAQISQLPNLFFKTKANGELNQLLSSMRNSLEKLQNNKEINPKDVIALLKLQTNIEKQCSEVKTKKDLEKFAINLIEQIDKNNLHTANIFDKLLQDKEELISYLKVFGDIYTNAGFHKINLYWLDENTLGISRDAFTNKINPSELDKMAVQNKLPRVKYKLIKQSEAPGFTVRYSVWVRYNPTKTEEENWQKLQKQLLADKKNFKIRRTFIPKFLP